MSDAQITELLERAGSDPDVDVSSLVSGGVARGRRARRRRAALVLGSTAAAITIGIGVLALALPGAEPERAADPSEPPVLTDPSAGVPAAPLPSEAPSRTPAMDPAETAEVLASVLPGPTSKHEVWHGATFQAGGLIWNGGRVDILIERQDELMAAAALSAQDWCIDSGVLGSCEQTEAGWLRLWSYAESRKNVETGVVGDHADLYTDDGWHISMSAYNASGEKADDPNGDPVLTMEELAKLVAMPVWLEDPQ